MRIITSVGAWLVGLLVLPVYATGGIISPLADNPEPDPAIAHSTIMFTTMTNTMAIQSSLSTAVANFVSISPTPTPPPLAEQSSAVHDTLAPELRSTRKTEMTITLLGDSMIDTLGPDGAGLATLLNAAYPRTAFTVINHGTGGENIDTGLSHLTNGYEYLGVMRPSVISQKPDVVVVESFGYNPYPYDDGALDTHWMQLSAMVHGIKQHLPDARIVIAATIAPNWNVFGDGAPFIDFSSEGKRTKTEEIKTYIESTIGYARSQHLPLADAYHPSMDSSGNGKLQYINAGDHIHYSDAGRALFAQKVADTIISNRLLE